MARNEKVDVVIVGAGASGSVFAAVLAKAGKKVVLLESGPDWKQTDLISSDFWGRRIKTAGADSGHPDHLCFRCDNFDALIQGARASGGIVVRPPVASQAFDGKRMAFVLYHALGLIEWVER